MVSNEKKDGKEEKEKGAEVITAIYKLNIHCQECANAIRKHLTRTEGVQKVDINIESSKVTVKGAFNPTKIHERLEKKVRRKVELVSPLPKKVEHKPPEKKEEKKEAVVRTTVIRVDMHCGKCEYDLKKRMLKLEGVHKVKTNREAQTCTVEGTIDPQKLIKYIRKKTRKHAEIVEKKQEKKEEKKEEKKDAKEKKDAEGKKEDCKNIDYPIPFFIHCNHAPQLFSDENPNACSIM